MISKIFIFIISLIIGFSIGYRASALNQKNIDPTDYSIRFQTTHSINERDLFDLIQRWRYDKYLDPYVKSDAICKFAELRLQEIKADFSHDKFYSTKNPPCSSCQYGENIAEGYNFSEEVLNAWINSPTHLENLEKDFKYSCIKTNGFYTVHTFSTL